MPPSLRQLLDLLCPPTTRRRRALCRLRQRTARVPPLAVALRPLLSRVCDADELDALLADAAAWPASALADVELLRLAGDRGSHADQRPHVRTLAAATPAAGRDWLPFCAGDYLLESPRDRLPSARTIAALLDELAAAPFREEALRGPDRRIVRNPARRPTGLQQAPLLAARDVERGRDVIDGPSLLGFDPVDPDLPYRLRDRLGAPNVFVTTEDPTTAHRLDLLGAAFAGAADLLGRQPDLRALPRPAPAPAGTRIVLQVDDFVEGGLEQVVIDLALALRGAEFAVTLLVLGRSGSAGARAAAAGIEIEYCVPNHAAYRALLQRCGAKLVCAHYSVFGAAIAADLGVPFVQTLHNMLLWFDRRRIADYRAADAATAAYVCVSNNVARYADLRLGLPPAKMVVVPNGCAPAATESSEAKDTGIPPNARMILHVAALQPSKAQHLVLESFAELAPIEGVAQNEQPTHLAFVGAPVDRAYARVLRALTQRLGIADRVHWLGQRADVAALLDRAHVMVMPSFFEGWSLAITEAVLRGVPVIATDVGGAREQLRDTDGRVIPAAFDDFARVGVRELLIALNAPHRELRSALTRELTAVLAQPRTRRIPADADELLASTTYGRWLDLLRWLLQGGRPAAARLWCRGTRGTEQRCAELARMLRTPE